MKEVIMKEFYSSIPNRWKAIYLIWLLIHFVLLTLSGNFFRFSYFDNDFFPFDTDSYDWSEFLIYSLTPIFIFFIYKIWVNDSELKLNDTYSNVNNSFTKNKETDSDTIQNLNANIGGEDSQITKPDKTDKSNISENKIILLRLIYFIYVILLCSIASAVGSWDYESFLKIFPFQLGQLAWAWFLVVIIGLIRKIMNKRPGYSFYFFYFFWTTLVGIYIIHKELMILNYLNNPSL